MIHQLHRDQREKKESGRTWTERCGRVYSFTPLDNIKEGDHTQGQHAPKTKVSGSCEKCKGEHSENQAIAAHLQHGADCKTPIHLYKNVEGICESCITALLDIAEEMKREIIVRDAGRFHRISK